MWTGPGRKLGVRGSVAGMKIADLASLSLGHLQVQRQWAREIICFRKYSEEFW